MLTTLHNVQSTKSGIFGMPENDFQNASRHIATTSKIDQTTANLQNMFREI